MYGVDWRDIKNGKEIPSITYSDQPYVVVADDGAWVCCLTTGIGDEGEPGQHIIVTRSYDSGKTWSAPQAIESPVGPESSYAVLLKVKSGRIFCFYNHNTDNLRAVKADCPPYENGLCPRVDSLGYFVFKFSDDHGKSWSDMRYTIPVREFEIDRNNPYGGEIRFFWNVGKPFIHESAGYVPLIKVGGFGKGFFTSTEGVLLMSENISSEKAPEKITWHTLPDGDIGIRSPRGIHTIGEEHSYCTLSDGSFFCVFRTVDGHPGFSYSRDGGQTWAPSEYLRFADGRLVRHSRAANFVWKCSNGRFLYWFHNHGEKSYSNRNPVWLLGGVEADSQEGKIILWSQPEIVLYDDDVQIRMSYPDLIEDNEKYYLTETQKDIARIHEIPNEFIEKIWQQFEKNSELASDPILEVRGGVKSVMPLLDDFLVVNESTVDRRSLDKRSGLTIEFISSYADCAHDIDVFTTFNINNCGIKVTLTSEGSVKIILGDGQTVSLCESDKNLIRNSLNHIAIIIDGGPKVISFILNGKFSIGDDGRNFGWGRFSPNMLHCNGANTCITDETIERLYIYDKTLMVSELVCKMKAEEITKAEIRLAELDPSVKCRL